MDAVEPKIFFLNCTLAEKGIDRLNKLFTSILTELDIDFENHHLTENITFLDKFSHLIISGSALLVSNENGNDNKLNEIIQQFINKRILGICYGHQILAKVLMKRDICRKSKIPELGWRNVSLVKNPLFKGILDPVFYESHLEEIIELDDNFTIIASNTNCDIQSYQFDNKPIWGVQFHPEVTHSYGKISIKNKLANNEELKKYYYNELVDPDQLKQNHKIFKNFIDSY
ncbi:MAG: gamma-glutamyl-gamma-aminobutyrate hydrolase family protein [Candidatus Tenebribacter davisii]|jgi:GMP synthase (glutamine-hydrolysing)|nr:gamma-glutamyl-gamma-aminobutyrate hydrolase family protein [Candidatus Tenebribacter davisii]